MAPVQKKQSYCVRTDEERRHRGKTTTVSEVQGRINNLDMPQAIEKNVKRFQEPAFLFLLFFTTDEPLKKLFPKEALRTNTLHSSRCPVSQMGWAHLPRRMRKICKAREGIPKFYFLGCSRKDCSTEQRNSKRFFWRIFLVWIPPLQSFFCRLLHPQYTAHLLFSGNSKEPR